MSIRDFFNKSYKVLSSDMQKVGPEAESTGNVSKRFVEKFRFLPPVDFEDPSSFAKFGSAKRYYEDSIKRIYNTYPYDGSLKERTEFSNESTYLDLYLLDNLYPRTTGYVTISPNGWGTQVSDVAGIGLPSAIEYVQVIGGPHTASGGMVGKDLSSTFEKSNIYDPDKERESNLKFDFNQGVTIETWIKKDNLVPSADSTLEFIFHLTNDETGTDTSGSIFVAMDTLATLPSDTPLQLYFVSGTVDTSVTFSDITNQEIIDGQWHHIAVTAQNSGSDVVAKAYLDGNLKSTQISVGNAIEQVTGSLIANIGASRPYSYGVISGLPEGSGKLSGSLDEFRYWKSARTSEEIGKFWFTQYGGGTNKDDANTDLGVYLKFNEGITGTSSIDSVALDYSGRISNGRWVGYTEQGRSTGSAINSYLQKESEFRDPIIYSFHPEVITLFDRMSQSGSVYDLTNNSSIYTSIPSWITEEDTEDNESTLETLTQIISSYLDTLYLQIENLPHIKDKRYDSLETKPLPFLDRVLESHGFVAPEIFANADVIAQILKKNEKEKFELDLTDIKNAIYKNIYNNLTYIYKSKGTEKAFRNLIRCFGVDDELVKINIYGDNVLYDFRDSYKSAAIRKKYADFNDPDRFDSTVYQQTASGNPNTLSYVPGVSSSQADYTAFTAEVEVIFPKKIEKRNEAYFPTNFLTSSIFGFHTADTGTVELTWKSPDYDLQVYAIRFEKESKDVYFSLQNTDGTINLTTDTFKDVYDNQRWNFAIRVSPDKTPHSNLPSGSSITDYKIEFSGINSEVDYISADFKLSASINAASGSAFLNEAKRLYLGSHRNNFTGSTLSFSDAKISSLRYWASYLSDEALQAHARDPSNQGATSPYGSTYLMQTSLDGVIVPEIATLALNWDFSTVTSSDAGISGVPFVSDAGYLVEDVSSGSLEIVDRYKWMGDVVNHQLTGRGDFYLANDTKVMDARYVYGGKQTLPEIVQASDTINSLGESDLSFTRDTRPIRHFFGIEKSMYQTISEDIISLFATIVDFNTLIGEPVNKYRGKYKYLEKLRQLYFEKVENEPDLEKFISFYSWIDQSLGEMLQRLIPASAEFSEDIRNMVESHVLERNKYRTKFPTLEFTPVDPEAGLNGINRLLYNWKVGHAPVNDVQSNNCYWWNARAERDNSVITSGDADVDSNRQSYLNVTINALNRSFTTPHRLKVDNLRQIKGGNNVNAPKAIDVVRSKLGFGTSNGMQFEKLNQLEDCSDELRPNEKIKKTGTVSSLPKEEYLDGVQPNKFYIATVYSSSVTTGYQASLGGGNSLENIHRDVYGPDIETPMQGPFTDTHVGGLQFRHVPINQGSDDVTNRPEGWILGATDVTHPVVDNPRAMYYRDETAKRPLNIKNIKGPGGNYDYDYQAVMTSGRSVNNRAFVKYGGFPLIDPIDDDSSTWVPDMATLNGAEINRTGSGGLYDWGPNKYIIVERFSAPGGPDTMGDANGGPGLDRYAAEMSPNNDLNYRNRFVRDVLQDLQTSHVNQFGYFSNTQRLPGANASTVNALNYAGTGSIYKTNRNTRYSYRLSGTTVVKQPQYDNWYVQHQIPQSDFQYAWITASYISSPYCGFLPADGAPYSSSVGLTDAITFSSASDFVSITRTGFLAGIYYGVDKSELGPHGAGPFAYVDTELYPTVYMGLNYNIYEPISVTSCQNRLGFSSGSSVDTYFNSSLVDGALLPAGAASLLNSIILKRGGPYGWPTWKQIRTAEHPVSRYFRENNQMVYNLSPGKTITNSLGVSIVPRFSDCKRFDEPCVVSKYKPIRQILNDSILMSSPQKLVIKSSYGNDLSFFSNGEVNVDLNLTAPDRLAYDSIKDNYIETQLIINPGTQDGGTPINTKAAPLLDGVKYKEIVFPAATNTYKKRNREREGYQNDFWRNSRSKRSALGKTKFGG